MAVERTLPQPTAVRPSSGVGVRGSRGGSGQTGRDGSLLCRLRLLSRFTGAGPDHLLYEPGGRVERRSALAGAASALEPRDLSSRAARDAAAAARRERRVYGSDPLLS